MYAHGDLLIIPSALAVTGKPEPVEGGRTILARGETTGHYHSIDARLGRLYRFRPDDMPSGLSIGLLVIDEDGARLEHQEHAPIALDPGTYEVRRQREYDAILEARLVQD